MTHIETNITSRTVKFVEYDTSKNWIEGFPTNNWCLIMIADEKKPTYFDEIIRKSIERNVGYICSIGKQHELIHEIADEEIAFRIADIEDLYLPKHTIITAGFENYEEGLFFGLNTTNNVETEIKEIIIVDLTKQAFKQTIEIIKKLEEKYF